MPLSRTKHLGKISWASLFAIGAAAQTHAQDSDWLRHFRIGVSSGMNIRTQFRSAGTISIATSNPNGINPQTNHTYDNGYVKLDATGDAAPTGPGGVPLGPTQTTNFSYTEAGQYDAGANTLSYRSARTFDLNAPVSNNVNDMPDLGFDMAYGATVRVWKHVALGWEFGFNMNILGPSDHSPLAGTSDTENYHYNTPPGAFPAPNTPGNPSGAGSVSIDDTPIQDPNTQAAGTITGLRKLDATIYNLRVGPQVRWEFYPRWTLNGSAGVAFSILDANYKFNETLTTGATATKASGHFGKTDFGWGGYAGAVAMYDTGANWEPYLGAHYFFMQDMKVASGGRSATVDLGSAVVISAGINWTF